MGEGRARAGRGGRAPARGRRNRRGSRGPPPRAARATGSAGRLDVAATAALGRAARRATFVQPPRSTACSHTAPTKLMIVRTVFGRRPRSSSATLIASTSAVVSLSIGLSPNRGTRWTRCIDSSVVSQDVLAPSISIPRRSESAASETVTARSGETRGRASSSSTSLRNARSACERVRPSLSTRIPDRQADLAVQQPAIERAPAAVVRAVLLVERAGARRTLEAHAHISRVETRTTRSPRPARSAPAPPKRAGCPPRPRPAGHRARAPSSTTPPNPRGPTWTVWSRTG